MSRRVIAAGLAAISLANLAVRLGAAVGSDATPVLHAAKVTVPAAQPPASQPAPPPTPVRAILPPTSPLPPEEGSAGITRFSFIVYGDTRGRRDGTDVQHEHSLVIDSMLRTIDRLTATPYAVRFVLQSGDAVVNGRDPAQWNQSFVDLINRITTEAGLPYFLAPGNHDVSGSPDLNAPIRQEGLRNYLAAVAQLIPPNGSSRRLEGYPAFAFGYGHVFVIALDSNIASDDRQFDWVKAQLEGLDRARYPLVVAFFHHAPFSTGPHGGPRVEAPTIALRDRYMPLFHKHHVRMTLAGHEHLFEHWVERYRDEQGLWHRMDHIVSGGGGAPLYGYAGEPDLNPYLGAHLSEEVSLEHLVKPGMEPGDNPYHYVVVRVDGNDLRVEVIGVDWGRTFAPYRSNTQSLTDGEGGR